MKSRARRQIVSTLAILAVLMNALAPTVSQARAMRAGLVQAALSGAWTEVCTAQGSRWVRLNEGGQIVASSAERPADAPAAVQRCGCAYCLAHAASFGLPPPDLSLALAALPRHGAEKPRALAVWPQRHDLWAAPAARAPPVSELP